MKIQYDGIAVDILERGEEFGAVTGSSYTIVKTDPNDAERVIRLHENGFEFLDRTIWAEIPITAEDAENRKRMIRYPVESFNTPEAYTADVYSLAEEAFARDRRFHLERDFSDKALAATMIHGYINRFKDDGGRLLKCFHKGELAGFIIIKETESRSCENVLGAVKPLYQSRGASLSLYCGMLDILQKENYQSVCGRISTKNVASLNLHNFLGRIKFSEPEDTYIFRKVK